MNCDMDEKSSYGAHVVIGYLPVMVSGQCYETREVGLYGRKRVDPVQLPCRTLHQVGKMLNSATTSVITALLC